MALYCGTGKWGSLKVEEAQILRLRHPITHSKKKTLAKGPWGLEGNCGKKIQTRSTPDDPDAPHSLTPQWKERCAHFQE